MVKCVKNVEDPSNHLLQCGSLIDFNRFVVLASDTNNVRLLFKHSLFIKFDTPVLDCTSKSFSLKLFDYYSFLIAITRRLINLLFWCN